jgi:diguanylate cyclase (GGDEF)-like protein/putative nucleotidyltransferase with HDIG domain
MPSVLLRRVRATLGEEAVDEVLRLSGVDYTAAYLDDLGNWIWYDEAVALFEAAATVTGDPRIGRRIGEETVRQHAGTQVATMFRSLGSPEKVYEQMALVVTKFSTVTELTPVEVGPGRAVVRAQARPGFRRHRHLCDWTTGLLSQPPALFGLPPGTVDETRCELRGDDHCLYEVTWDADRAASAADPQELITALESQLTAVTDQLESVYATAGDLIAVDDVDAVLARITERAATAVRTPSYLLAVRTRSGGKLHVHHRGFVNEDPEEAARALLEGPGGSQDESSLIAEVASATHHYGRLKAASPAGAFFPHERDLFELYARYAAAVLDTATALEDARNRHEQSRALLELSQSLAEATTSDEVAKRLVDAVPAVVDCDRIGAFLWDDSAGALTCRAMTELSGDTGDIVRALRLHPSDTPMVADLVEKPKPDPLFFDPDTEDRFMRETMGKTGSQALVVVPIVAHDHFYGILTVSALEDPERLRPDPELLDRLAGVVAQAATALDNARLLETMTHQARHDNLTGLLGHRAFQEALEHGVTDDGDGDADRMLTLATIDIDDFKIVNDLHGHPIGDEALRRVAEALRRAVRDQDSVFRVGGEEFAVLLPGLTASDAMPVAERLRTAVAAIPFALPLRISIGLASWPADASDRDALLERADDALYSAKHSGKDRTSIASRTTRDAAGGGASWTGLLHVLRGKEGGTLAHSAEVAALCVEVGRELGLDGERMAELRIAGQLHDIGKVAVPDVILQKPGPLDEDQRRLVQMHPITGAELVRAWGLERPARFVLEHHENVDGSGYPAGLTGEEITLEARILHTVDAFAAMTRDRPYRDAMSVEEALDELRRFSGKQFDPEAVVTVEAVIRAAEAGGGAESTGLVA